MFEYPKILNDPFDSIYNLKNSEIYSIKETNEAISTEKYSYCLFAFWNAVIINLQRRIEKFDIDIFLKLVDKDEHYVINGNSLNDRWLNISEYNIIQYAKNLHVISEVTHSILCSLYWMKIDATEKEIDNVELQELLSIIYLVEKNLFLSEFKEDKRNKNPSITNSEIRFRRREDNETVKINLPQTYHDLILRSGLKVFEEENKRNKSLNDLNKYG